MKIVLCCAGGLSTTMLMNSMMDAVRKSPKLNEDDFEMVAIPVDLLDSEVAGADAVVLGPQIAHKLDVVRKGLGKQVDETPIVVVDKTVYGQMDGATVLKKVLVERRRIELAKEGR